MPFTNISDLTMACIDVLILGAFLLVGATAILQQEQLQTCQSLIRQHNGPASETPVADRLLFISERPNSIDVCTDECISSMQDGDDEDAAR